MKLAKGVILVVLVQLAKSAYGTESSVTFIHADEVHAQGVDGFGITVAVIDSGVDYSHPGLLFDVAPGGVSIIGGVRSYDLGVDPNGPGHGTLVSLIITDSTGVAPCANILPVRVKGPGGTTKPRDLQLALNYVIERTMADHSIRVINASQGSTSYSCPCDWADPLNFILWTAVARAMEEGLLTFAPTGNAVQCGSIDLLACLSDVVKVAASYDDDYGVVVDTDCVDWSAIPYRVTCFSNIGEDCAWLLAAPGYDIAVGGFEQKDGTSFAAPYCSGVAALMFSKNPCSLTPQQARQIIYDSATPYYWAYPYCPLEPQPKHVNALTAVNAVPAPVCASLGDLDCDELVSAYDYQRFERCMSGPDAAYAHTFCACTDFPESPADGDIDLRDLRLLELGLDGWGSGACCHADGTCSVTTVYGCLGETGGTYNGHDSTCADADCEMTRYNNTIDPPAGYAPAGAGLKLADDLTLNGTGGGMLTGYWLLVYGGGGGTFNVTVQLYTACPGEGGTPIAGTQHTFNSFPDGEAVDLIADFDPPVYIPHNVWMVATFSNTQAGWFIAEQAEVGYTEDRFARYDPSWGCWYWYGSGGPYICCDVV